MTAGASLAHWVQLLWYCYLNPYGGGTSNYYGAGEWGLNELVHWTDLLKGIRQKEEKKIELD